MAVLYNGELVRDLGRMHRRLAEAVVQMEIGQSLGTRKM